MSKNQIKNVTQVKPILESSNIKKNFLASSLEKVTSINELILLTSRKKEIQLKYDLENKLF